MNLLLKNAAASLAVICIAATAFGTLITIPAAPVASVAIPALA